MKAGRGIYDCGDVLVTHWVTTARAVRLKNCYKKARKWDRGGMVRMLLNIRGKLSSYM